MATLKISPQLPNILSNNQKGLHPLLILQYDLSTSPWPLVRQLLMNRPERQASIVLSLLHPPTDLLGRTSEDHSGVTFLDWSQLVPEYLSPDGVTDPCMAILEAIKHAPDGPLQVIIDSVDTLCMDLGSISATIRMLSAVLSSLHPRQSDSKISSRLVLPIPAHSALLPPLINTSFSQTLTHLTLHHVAFIKHIYDTMLISPDFGDIHPSDRFWNIFMPSSQRGEGENLILGGTIDAKRGSTEGVAVVLIRSGRRRVERTVEAWKPRGMGPVTAIEACRCDELTLLKPMVAKTQTEAVGPSAANVAHELSFNLSLTESQQEARAKVPLPYAHQGQSTENRSYTGTGSTIQYDPDSADDLDDEDPDEDLDL